MPDTHTLPTYEHLLIATTDDTAMYRQLQKLEQKKFFLLKRINRFQRLAAQSQHELDLLESSMAALSSKVRK